MTQQEYENKRRERWKEFQEEVLNGNISYCPIEAFDYAFDRAYALGKQKETVTQEEIEKAAKEYAETAYYPAPDYNWYESDDEQMRECLSDTFRTGANFTLGKQEKEADTVIQGWVARDECGDLYMYICKPKKISNLGYWDGDVVDVAPSNNLFPDLTWESEPQEVEIIIKRKKNE